MGTGRRAASQISRQASPPPLRLGDAVMDAVNRHQLGNIAVFCHGHAKWYRWNQVGDSDSPEWHAMLDPSIPYFMGLLLDFQRVRPEAPDSLLFCGLGRTDMKSDEASADLALAMLVQAMV